LPGIDAAAMRRRLGGYFATMRAGYSERDYLRRSTDEIFPPSFPNRD
jgi:8-oxoguanine deaminase